MSTQNNAGKGFSEFPRKIDTNIWQTGAKKYEVRATLNGKRIVRACSSKKEAIEIRGIVKAAPSEAGLPGPSKTGLPGPSVNSPSLLARPVQLTAGGVVAIAAGIMIAISLALSALDIVLSERVRNGAFAMDRNGAFAMEAPPNISASGTAGGLADAPTDKEYAPTASPQVADQQKTTDKLPAFPADLMIQMGSPENKAKHKLYVFADPTCSACKALEPALEKLTDVAITIIPVPILETGDRYIPGLSCAKDKALAWKKAINDGIASRGDCPTGASAGGRSLAFFQAFGFRETPTLISGDGRVHPGSFGGDVKSIRNWLNEIDAASSN